VAQARAFRRHLAERRGSGHMIIGGDFNELKLMPAIRALAADYHRVTGTFRQPTWRWRGQRKRFLQANYDNILWSRDPGLRMHEFSVLPFAPSDHAPLLARFSIVAG